MNLDTLETLQNYIEIYSFFNEKIYEINTNEILNINIQNQNNSSNNSNNYTTELDNQKKLIALFFMYLMQIDKDSILNKHIL